MKNSIKSAGLILALSLAITACKKDKTVTPTPVPTTPTTPIAGNLDIEFEGLVGADPLVLATQTYTNIMGNSFNVTTLKYYISNIKLTKMDNTVWAETESYHLVNYTDEPSTVLHLANVPYANYKAIEFMIGVDSTRNVSGAQTGALDPSKDMFWTWNSGYIMAKMEGTSPQSTAVGNKVEFHIGGFTGANKTMRIITPSFNNDTAKVTTTITPEIHLSVDISKFFGMPNMIDFSTLNTLTMPGANAVKIADNYATMFLVEHIHNDPH